MLESDRAGRRHRCSPAPFLAGPCKAGLPGDEAADREPAGTASLWRVAVPTAILPPDPVIVMPLLRPERGKGPRDLQGRSRVAGRGFGF
jgi:hypothetical protein